MVTSSVWVGKGGWTVTICANTDTERHRAGRNVSSVRIMNGGFLWAILRVKSTLSIGNRTWCRENRIGKSVEKYRRSECDGPSMRAKAGILSFRPGRGGGGGRWRPWKLTARPATLRGEKKDKGRRPAPAKAMGKIREEKVI